MEAVILAAGESSRFRPLSDRRHKCLTEVMGKTVIEHTMDELRDNGINDITVIQGPDENIEEKIEDESINYIVQDNALGMGNAVKQAEEKISSKFLVLTPYRSKLSYFLDNISESEKENIVVGEKTKEYDKYGIIDLEDGYAKGVVEKPGEEKAPSEWRIVGMYLLGEEFFNYLENVPESEYSFEEALSELMNDKDVPMIRQKGSSASLKYPWDLFEVIKERFKKSSGKISEDAEIADSAVLKGKVIVEDGAKIMENAVIKGPVYIGENSKIGDNAVVRDLTSVESNATVGSGSEVKKTLIEPEASFHSGYIGDSIIGRKSSFGAGTVVANRLFKKDGKRPEIEVRIPAKNSDRGTGMNSLGVVTGEEVQVGVNSSIMPGILLGSGSRILPGSTVTENLDNKEVYGR